MAIKHLQETSSEWWRGLTPEQRREYLAKHPKSRRAHTQVKPGLATSSPNGLAIVKDSLKVLKATSASARGTWYFKIHTFHVAEPYLQAQQILMAKFGKPTASTIGDTRWVMPGFKVFVTETAHGTRVLVYETI